MQPVTTRRAPGRRSSLNERTVSIDSSRAASMNAHVFTTTTSASEGSSAATSPSATSVPTSLSESTLFFGHPRVSTQNVFSAGAATAQMYRDAFGPPPPGARPLACRRVGEPAGVVEPSPPLVTGRVPWVRAGMRLLRDPTEFFADARRRVGDTFRVEAFGYHLLCVFS